ncbi:MAG TPA: DUF1214 domain-containing protein [Candidatus Binatia bacterium]|jgi:hypothetical protein|nr:DUF1214 domain-containing protein [Candidatus Binatia bacterium]
MTSRSRWRGTPAKVTATVVVALVLGVGSAVWAVRRTGGTGGVTNGAWQTNAHIGSSTADPYLRAAVAMAGLLALNRTETIYYTATTDDAGAPLRSDCRYRVEGRDPPTRWWSITAYGADHYLVANPRHAYSVDRARVQRDADGAFTIVVGGEPRDANWIATAPAGETFSLTLRLYEPDGRVADDLAGTVLPRIQREDCA